MKKINLKENIKNWLLTLGIASCFGLAAFGFNAAQTYKQTSAYDYEDNGSLSFDLSESYNCELLYHYYLDYIFMNDSDMDTEIWYSTSFYGVDYPNPSFDDLQIINYFAVVDYDYSLGIYGVVFNQTNSYDLRQFVWDNDIDNCAFGLYVSDNSYDYYDSIGVSYVYVYNTNSTYYDLLNYVFSYQVPIISTYQINVSSIATFNAIYNYVYAQTSHELDLSSYIISGNNTYNYNSISAFSYDDELNLDFNNDSGNHVTYKLSSNTVTVGSSDAIGSGEFTLTLTSELSNTNYRALIYAIESYNAPQSTGNFLTALTDFTSLIVGGITNLAEGIATGVVSMATSLFIDNSALSIYGAMVAIFAGLALAVGITTKVYTWVTTLGN